ncbi:MAG: ClpX C4-type zinc finger protein [Candidatus Dormibacteraeota bacterium]|nr:ClpX C4-type zinc finger protein [Candidatus Dormibacteraeota bacterium]
MIFRRKAKAPKVVRHRPKCSFCGKERGEKGVQLVAGSGVFICSECVHVAGEILRGHNPPAPAGT